MASSSPSNPLNLLMSLAEDKERPIGTREAASNSLFHTLLYNQLIKYQNIIQGEIRDGFAMPCVQEGCACAGGEFVQNDKEELIECQLVRLARINESLNIVLPDLNARATAAQDMIHAELNKEVQEREAASAAAENMAQRLREEESIAPVAKSSKKKKGKNGTKGKKARK